MKTYTTVLGDTFDRIALQQLGSEYLFPHLLRANPKHRTTIIFSAGIVLTIPDLPQEGTFIGEPDWLAGDGDASMQEEIDSGGAVG